MMKDEGIPVSVVHQGIQKYSVFGGCRGEFEGQRVFDERHIALPVHPSISDEDCGRIVDRIRHGW
jgi:dTDP-4-amino-4,6-dideoxygalactose transaminase